MSETFEIFNSYLDEKESFKNLYIYFYPRLFIFSKAILKEKPLAEDAVEEVFLKLWENRKMLPTIQKLSYYLFVATKHACLKIIQRQKRIETISLDDMDDDFCFTMSNPETQLLAKECVKLIEESLNHLPNKCRLIFYLVKEEKLKHKEIAQILDISIKTIESQMTIAYKKISEMLNHMSLFESEKLSKKHN